MFLSPGVSSQVRVRQDFRSIITASHPMALEAKGASSCGRIPVGEACECAWAKKVDIVTRAGW